jgi:hypothetical protein
VPSPVAGIAAIALVGVSLGWLGAGGTAIALPILVYAVGIEPHQAVAFSILLVGGVSAYGVVLHARKGAVRWREAFAFAPCGIVGALLGSRVSYLLSGRALLLSFSVLLAVIGGRMLLDQRNQAIEQHPRHLLVLSLCGLGIGAMTGVLGNGGGFVIVPALVYLAGLGMREAMATSLAVIAINSAAAFAGHASQRQPEWSVALPLLISAAAGMTLGVGLSHRTDPGGLRRYFALLLLGLGAFMAWKNL